MQQSKSRNIFFIFVSLVLLFLCNTNANAQLQEVNSPYSYIGLGQLKSPNFATNRAMGGFSSAYQSAFNINYNNPASYSAIKLTTFEIGIEGKGLWLQQNEQTQRTGNGALSYMSFAFPANKYWTLTAGMLPFSSLNYDITQQDYIETVNDTLNYRFIGTGQLYQLYFGNGFKYKNISAGFNLGYVFGTYKRYIESRFANFDDTFFNLETKEQIARGFIWNAGLQYKFSLSEKMKLVVGVNGNNSIGINAENENRWERYRSSDNNLIDTILYSKQKEKMVLPTQFSGGLMLKNGADWQIGTDITYYKWEDFRNFGQADTSLINAMKFSFGAGFTPDARSLTKFWQNTNYRIGFYYHTGSIQIAEQKLSEFAVTFGAALPLRRSASRLNLSFEIGQRGSTTNNLIRETFFTSTIGVSLNDRWFIKRKYD